MPWPWRKPLRSRPSAGSSCSSPTRPRPSASPSAARTPAPALSRLDWLLRDFRANEQTQMDPLLYDQLADLAVAAGVEPRFEVISGYRSPRTNAALAEAGHGVARYSLHMEGRAIDVRLRGVDQRHAARPRARGARGGVGYYRDSDFVHVDTGRVRTWTG
ncbi:MAG: DUF882 domain-containing protein [Steroidobacteraceae bacterium]